jgi:hypothetical protein
MLFGGAGWLNSPPRCGTYLLQGKLDIGLQPDLAVLKLQPKTESEIRYELQVTEAAREDFTLNLGFRVQLKVQIDDIRDATRPRGKLLGVVALLPGPEQLPENLKLLKESACAPSGVGLAKKKGSK